MKSDSFEEEKTSHIIKMGKSMSLPNEENMRGKHSYLASEITKGK